MGGDPCTDSLVISWWYITGHRHTIVITQIHLTGCTNTLSDNNNIIHIIECTCRLKPISPGCTHSDIAVYNTEFKWKRCTYRTFMRNDKKWTTLQILIVLFAVVSALVHLAWFHLKWPKGPGGQQSGWTIVSVRWTCNQVLYTQTCLMLWSE